MQRTLCQLGLATSWCAEHGVATRALHDCLRMAKHRGAVGGKVIASTLLHASQPTPTASNIISIPNAHVEATLALDVHEVRVGRLYQALELVLALLKLRRGIEQVNIACEHL